MFLLKLTTIWYQTNDIYRNLKWMFHVKWINFRIFYLCPYILYVDQKYFFAYLFGKLCFLKRSRASSSALVLKALTSFPPPPGPDILMGSRKSDAKVEVAKKKVTMFLFSNRNPREIPRKFNLICYRNLVKYLRYWARDRSVSGGPEVA